MTRLSASFPWGMQNCKQMTRLNSLHPFVGACKIANTNQKKETKKTKETRQNNAMSEALWPSRSSWFSCFFSHFASMYH